MEECWHLLKVLVSMANQQQVWRLKFLLVVYLFQLFVALKDFIYLWQCLVIVLLSFCEWQLTSNFYDKLISLSCIFYSSSKRDDVAIRATVCLPLSGAGDAASVKPELINIAWGPRPLWRNSRTCLNNKQKKHMFLAVLNWSDLLLFLIFLLFLLFDLLADGG